MYMRKEVKTKTLLKKITNNMDKINLKITIKFQYIQLRWGKKIVGINKGQIIKCKWELWEVSWCRSHSDDICQTLET